MPKSQVADAVRYAQQVIVLFNGYLPHVAGGAPLRNMLEEMRGRRCVRIILPSEWVISHFNKEGITCPRRVAFSDEATHLPTTVLAAKCGNFRAIILHSDEEIEATESETRRLWRFAARVCQDCRPRRHT